MPRINWVLFIVYAVASLGIFGAVLIFPEVRAVSYAPLRELVLPPPAPVVVSLLYSTEKDAWLKEALADFEATHPTVDSHPVQVTLKAMGSREIYLAVLNGTEKPDLISPASSLQISILQDLSASQFGAPVVSLTDHASCQPILTTPLVVVGWKDRATALWGATPGSALWSKLHDALVDPQGWQTYGHPEWGFVKFGHTDPLKSNSGFMAILLMTYDYLGKTNNLTSADMLSNPGYQQWFTSLEGTITDFGDSTGPYMRDMIAYGPSKYDLIAVYEATAIEQAENAVGRYGELRVFYPPATVLSDHPFCILHADWVTPQQAQAAKLFVDYLASRPMQELALLKYGFRPVDQSIPLDQPGSPFNRYRASGFSPTLPPQVQVPPGTVLNTLLDFWSRHVAPH